MHSNKIKFKNISDNFDISLRGVRVLDTDKRIIFVNKTYLEMTKSRSYKEIIGKKCYENMISGCSADKVCDGKMRKVKLVKLKIGYNEVPALISLEKLFSDDGKSYLTVESIVTFDMLSSYEKNNMERSKLIYETLNNTDKTIFLVNKKGEIIFRNRGMLKFLTDNEIKTAGKVIDTMIAITDKFNNKEKIGQKVKDYFGDIISGKKSSFKIGFTYNKNEEKRFFFIKTNAIYSFGKRYIYVELRDELDKRKKPGIPEKEPVHHKSHKNSEFNNELVNFVDTNYHKAIDNIREKLNKTKKSNPTDSKKIESELKIIENLFNLIKPDIHSKANQTGSGDVGKVIEDLKIIHADKLSASDIDIVCDALPVLDVNSEVLYVIFDKILQISMKTTGKYKKGFIKILTTRDENTDLIIFEDNGIGLDPALSPEMLKESEKLMNFAAGCRGIELLINSDKNKGSKFMLRLKNSEVN